MPNVTGSTPFLSRQVSDGGIFMLDSFIFSLNTTLPVFLVIAAGMLLKKLGVFSESYASMTDRFVFKVALPVLLFKDIANMDFRQDFDVKFVLFCVCATLCMFLGTWALSALFIRDKSIIGSFVQGSARGSAAILGIALAVNIYGSSGLAPLMILSAVPLFNVLSVIILSVHNFSGTSKVGAGTVLKNIITNPIILGILCGIPFSLLDIKLPLALSKTVDSISGVATPMALLAIGASFSFESAKQKLKPAIAASFIKLFLLPCIFLPVAVLFGFSGSALVAIFVMIGSPTTVTCYIMSKNIGNDHVLSSNIIMLATLFSSVSVTFWVFLMKLLQLI